MCPLTRTLSYVDVLNGEAPPALLAGKLVLIGMTADGQGDRYAVPTSHGLLMPGVEIQAALADTLISGREIRAAPGWIAPTAGLLCLVILMSAFLVLSPRWGLAAAAALIALALLASALAFAAGLWLPPLAVVVALALACPLWSWRRLAATSSYLDAELGRFMQDAAVVPARAAGAGLGAGPGPGPAFGADDVVGRQVRTLREAVARLRGRNRFVSDTLESLPDAAVVVNVADTVLYANQRARDLFARPDIEGLSLRDELARLNPDLAAARVEGGEAMLEDGRCLRLDSATLSDGDEVRRIVRLADVTALRAAERQREQALQLLGHDMRAPQTAILSLIDGAPETSDPSLDRIADYARMTLKLADDYVRLARAEAGPLNLEPLGFSDLAVEAADILWPVARARGVRIEVAEAPEIEIAADRGLVTRALMNLMDNAVKHSPRGGVVRLAFETTGDRAHVSVRDEGPGLSPDDFARLVRPFAHAADGRAGVGLGLAFIDQVACRHGGELTLAAPSRGCRAGGATFRLSLPAALALAFAPAD